MTTTDDRPDALAGRPWQDRSLAADDRARLLLAAMTLEEKVAQLGSYWPADLDAGRDVAPMHETVPARAASYAQVRRHGLGHLTRAVGSEPVTAAEGARRLAELQRELVDQTRLGVPAVAHEECLTGFTTYGATVYPTSLAWAATFDAGLVEAMARAIGADMRALGVHQGLSPVLDVVRDYRWGRVEETLGEDPYLVGVLGTAYVRGLESAGVTATLKHFVGYSASRAARNHAPVSMGRRELREVMLPPFEMAVRDGRAGSVMNSYSDIDGVPVGADASLLTGVLREEWGFDGVVVSDYWSVFFLRSMHRVADTAGRAGALALQAGIDVELPDTACYGAELIDLVRSGAVPEEVVDRAAGRVLRHKARLGLLDPDWSPDSALETAATVDLDSAANRDISRRLAERSVVLLANDAGVLPMTGARTAPRTLAVVGPCADDPLAFLGCYSYPNHVLPRHPELGLGIAAPSLLAALRAELPGTEVTHRVGCPVREPDRSGIEAAVAAARDAEVCVAVVGDRAGLFGAGTSGEGCDAPDLALPGVQGELVSRLLETGTPVVLVVVSGRPYALGDYAAAAAIVQAFMPGEEGGPALAGVLSGRITPSGHLPVQIPRIAGGQPSTYLQPPLGREPLGMSHLDPTPLFAFGHGLSYTTFDYSDLAVDDEVATDGELPVSVVVRNTGERAGDEVVQLYVHGVQALVTRPVLQLAGFARVSLPPGAAARVTFTLPADLTGFVGPDLRRVVEPGDLQVSVGRSSAELPCSSTVRLAGPTRVLGHDRALTTSAAVELITST